MPQHPPDTFFIRRDPDLVKRYLNPTEFNELYERA
jgi:hypothetical protein